MSPVHHHNMQDSEQTGTLARVFPKLETVYSSEEQKASFHPPIKAASPRKPGDKGAL